MKPLRYSQQKIEEEDIAAVVRVMRSPYLTQGPEVEAFEAELAKYVGAKYAVAVSSGTAALQLAYMAACDDTATATVVTSPLSFVATANAAELGGLDVAFRDVDAATGLLVPGIGYMESGALHVPVHYAGRAAAIPSFGSFRDDNPLSHPPCIEDACHALGAMDFDGCSKVGSCAHSLATCFSFHPVKPITTGEGGAITTNDPTLYEKLRVLRSHGRLINGDMVMLGYNYRMTEMQAALGSSQLSRCDEMRGRRFHLARRYVQFFDEWSDSLDLPRAGTIALGAAWHLFPIRIKGCRDTVKAALNAQGIGAQVHYKPIHLQPYYRERFGYKPGDFPEAEAWGAEELSLPLHAGMVEADVDRVCKALKEAL